MFSFSVSAIHCEGGYFGILPPHFRPFLPPNRSQAGGMAILPVLHMFRSFLLTAHILLACQREFHGPTLTMTFLVALLSAFQEMALRMNFPVLYLMKICTHEEFAPAISICGLLL